MRIIVHIGPDAAATDRLQQVLQARHEDLRANGVLHAQAPGARNHTRLFMAVSDPGAVDALRFNRGYMLPGKQAELRDDLRQRLMQEVEIASPDLLILSAHQLGSGLSSRSEFKALRDLLSPISQDITLVAHLDDPARMLVRRYGAQLLEGRNRSLALELGVARAQDWWQSALRTRPAIDPQAGQFAEAQGAVFWLDFARMQHEWETVFGKGAMRLRSLDLTRLYGPDAAQEMCEAFGISGAVGPATPERPPAPMSAAWMTRCRLMNDALLRLLAQRGTFLPRPLWRKLLGEIKVHGRGIAPGSLGAISERFADDITALCAQHPGLNPAAMAPDAPLPSWTETDPTLGFRATQYLLAFRKRIEKASAEESLLRAPELAQLRAAQTPRPQQARPIRAKPPEAPPVPALGPDAERHMPASARQAYARLARSPYAPHDRLGQIDEEQRLPPYDAAPRAALPEGSSGTVIIACMKNEAPYIAEWVAHHRALGVDGFLVYTNDCDDGTAEILDRLQQMGVVEHRRNDDWQGKSPQQWALDRALTDPLVQQAAWIIHIDVDEFINVRCGNGTLGDLLARVPDATNIAMTWRLFGNDGVRRLEDRLVIDQFEACAPKFCPKPHTAWGFKSMIRNIGAYGKLSCHRPNKLAEGAETRVRWVNGSGEDMTAEALRNGWRSSKKTIGYDLVQLNHYPLRSAESFLVKRQRGRALHVDRTIGLNYWIRMDWSGARDITIKRNLPRVRAEYERLLADPELGRLHVAGFDWHRAKAAELRTIPEFAELFEQAQSLNLTATERAAYSLALDMES
ncbi:glycosyltransferase family 2 protein [Salipiger pallidus]|uniref:glycosyltransferase family 2 protein n=1 Tax=Salipiger pallidus TaxID=1775170 RepID=UPI00166AD9E4|nr:glycosyltransferase family 2 protein [Salipiger pallidus]